MTRLNKTDLSTPQKASIAASAMSLEGEYGSTLELVEKFGVSKPTIYDAGETAAKVLEDYFERDPNKPDGVWVWVDDAQLNRAIVVLRIVSPTGIRPIEDLLGTLYPGISEPSYGKIQSILKVAEEKGSNFNNNVELSNLKEGALDEMFSQGDPVLAGVDLDSGFLFLLSHEDTRKAEDWERLLKQCQDQGLELEVVVKDAAKGIAAGVSSVFPDAEQRDDCFHALFTMGKVRRTLEKRALGAIAREIEAEEQKKPDLAKSQEKCQEAMNLHDSFEQAMKDVQEEIEFVDLKNNTIRTPDQMQENIKKAANKMKKLANKECARVGKYIKNRAEGLALYMKELNIHFNQLGVQYGATLVLLSAIFWRLYLDLENDRRPYSKIADAKRLSTVYHQIMEIAGEEKGGAVLKKMRYILERRFRASSAIEGFNAALRPHLYVHKGVSQGFLELFKAYYNLRTRRWGRHKATSAYESLTGKSVKDWLTTLGFPPSTAIH